MVLTISVVESNVENRVVSNHVQRIRIPAGEHRAKPIMKRAMTEIPDIARAQ
jgi:hypothetical protein